MGRGLRQACLMAGKDTRSFLRDRFAVGFAFLFPMLFVFAFSLAFSELGPEDEPLVFRIATQEVAEGLSHQIAGAMAEATEGARIAVVPYEEALAAVERREMAGVIVFPADFTARYLSGEPTALEVITAGGETDIALEGLAFGMAARLSGAQVAVRALAELDPGASPTALRLGELLEGPGLLRLGVERVGDIRPFKPSNFTLPGYLVMFVFFAAALGAEAIARERQSHTLERLVATGVLRDAIVAGKWLGIAIRGVLQLCFLWGVGIFVLRINVGVSPLALALISVLLVVASSGAGVLLASLVRTPRAASSAGILLSLVLAPLGGSWWPLFIAPDWLQLLGRFTPHGWANTAFNKLMLFGAEFGDVVPEMLVLLAFAGAFLGLAFWRFRTEPPA